MKFQTTPLDSSVQRNSGPNNLRHIANIDLFLEHLDISELVLFPRGVPGGERERQEDAQDGHGEQERLPGLRAVPDQRQVLVQQHIHAREGLQRHLCWFVLHYVI